MLLPSAIPCDRSTQDPKLQRPKLTSFDPYAPSAHLSFQGSILASCRALQSILGGPVRSPSIAPEPCVITNPFALGFDSRQPPQEIVAPRGLNKRRRDEFEDDENEPMCFLSTGRQIQFGSPIQDRSRHSSRHQDQFQTPKRQRRIPLDIPAGLQASDFASLATPCHSASRIHVAVSTPEKDRNVTLIMPPIRRDVFHSTDSINQGSRSTANDICSGTEGATSALQTDCEHNRELWSPSDDRRLVEAVLSKLNLSKRDWNDCAKQLGKDKDSLGRRWKLLIGEGNVGLRRGLGRHERSDLDIQSWL